MSFTVELTISGLILTVLKSKGDPAPKHPAAIDLLCPTDRMHRSRLSYNPLHVTMEDDKAEMIVDVEGNRIASYDLQETVLEFVRVNQPNDGFTVKWTKGDPVIPGSSSEEEWMNWVPSLADLGFGKFTMPDSGLPGGANTRVVLPPGTLLSQSIVRDRKNEYIVYAFPANGKKSALANDLVFRTEVADTMRVTVNGSDILTINQVAGVDTIRMCLSNDMRFMPSTYGSGAAALIHMKHFDSIAPKQLQVFASGKFEPPTPVDDQLTGDPICNGARYVHDGRG
jgi:hypothetical protein